MQRVRSRVRAPMPGAATAILAAAFIAIAMNPAAASARSAASSCTTMTLPVALAPGDPANQEVFAEYCTPSAQVSTVDVLVPGATYNHAYWDWPQDPGRYSYTAKTLAAGRAVLAYDPVGTGQSSRPLSTSLTLGAAAYVLHQLIGWIRTRGYHDVDVIGHSLGSMVATQDAGTWPADPSRLVLTGDLHLAAPGEAVAAGEMHPAIADRAFAGTGLDPGYLTTRPGTRAGLFYYDGDPGVVAYDEVHKDVVSGTEFTSALAALFAPAGFNISNSITAPVLTVVGQEDFLLCVNGPVNCADWSALRNGEAPFYTAAASLTAESVPATGHDLALNRTADQSFQLIDSWLRLTSPATAPSGG